MRLPKFSESQIGKLSDIAADLGLIAVAAVVLPSVLEKFNLWYAVIGSIAALVFWAICLNLLKGK